MNDMTPYDVRRIVSCSTTTNAYRSIVDGRSDIIFVAGPSEEQEAYAKEHGVELIYTPIGREAFVFFVHPDNPISGLTIEDLRSIYSGETTRWDQLGVKNLGKILAYQRDEGSGSQTALERFVMKDTPLMPATVDTGIDGMGGIVESVSAYKNHRNAIGFSFRFYCTALMKDFDVKLLSINGIAPTVENIENGTYPLASSFYAVTRSDADAETLALVEWICGPQGQKLIEETGYTPIG
jgi:phosphate transport system substrate-binding protein